MDTKSQIISLLTSIDGISDIKLEIPEREEFGEYSTNVAMKVDPEKVGLDKSSSSKKVADTILSKLNKNEKLLELVEKVEIAGPGFINFRLKNDLLIDNLIQIVSKPEDFGKTNLLGGKKIMIEFAHPNTHKQFHIGHLRNITTGESISRILERAGAHLIRVNYQGDVGLHIAKAIWGINKIGFCDPEDIQERAEFLGKAYTEGNKAYEEDGAAKEEIQKINEDLYKGDNEKLMELYRKTRKWSLDYFDFIYKRVYTKFDRLYFESEVTKEGYKLSKEAKDKGILKESEGAVIFPGGEYALHDRVFITSRDVLTYEGKDMGLARLQFKEYDPDILIHLVGPEQTDYFKVVFKALEMILPETKDREKHLSYGWVRLKEGKMSSRTGNVVLGNWLLDEAKSKIIELYKSDKDTAEDVAVGAVKYSFLKNSLNQEIAFDINESVSLEGNSGPYLQYTYARIKSVMEKSKFDEKGFKLDSKKLDIKEEERSLLRYLIYYPQVIEESAQNYAPNLLCNYLYGLAQKFNTFYNKYRIIGSDFRLSLAVACGSVLESGLDLLGIKAPERM